jgi:hypothetical protein
MWYEVSQEVTELCRTQAQEFITPKLFSFIRWIEEKRAQNPLCSLRTRSINKLWDLPNGSFYFDFASDRSKFDELRKEEAEKRDGYYEFRIWYMNEFDGLFPFIAACPQNEQRNIAIAMLERFSGVLIGYNPEFDVVRQAEANINDFKNPFKDFVADTILETLKTAGLLS